MRGAAYRLILLGLLQGLFSSASFCFQVSKQENRCPTRPDSSTPNPAQQEQIVVDAVEFQPDTELPLKLRPQIIERVKKQHFDVGTEPDTSWVNDLTEAVRELLQNEGYFKAVVDMKVGLVKAEPSQLHYWVSVDAQSVNQYRLGSVGFTGTPQFPESTLRKAIPLNEGDIFDVSKIRKGTDKIRSLYENLGYIDATIEPQTTIQGDASRIDIHFIVDAGGQYRIGTIDIRGLDPSVENILRSRLSPGEVFNRTVLDDFLDRLSQEDVNIHRDVKAHVLSISIDARTCTSTAEQ